MRGRFGQVIAQIPHFSEALGTCIIALMIKTLVINLYINT